MAVTRRRGVRRCAVALTWVVVVLAGSAAGLVAVAHQTSRIGPVDVRLSLRPAISGGSTVEVPPLGTMTFDSHSGPVALAASVRQLRPDVVRRLADEPQAFATLGDRVGGDLRAALRGLLLRGAAGALLGVLLLGVLVLRSVRATASCLALTLVGLLGVAGVTTLTRRPESVREPRFTGLLTSAPIAVGGAEEVVNRFSQYRLALGQLVGNVVELYDVTSSLPTYRPGRDTIAVLHVSDLHLNPAGIDLVAALVRQFHVQAVLDTGDLTDHGTSAEAAYVADLRRVGAPYVFIRGNHDSTATVDEVARVAGATVLDGSVTTVAGLRIAGISDPRFTPDKTAREQPGEAVVQAGERLAATVRAEQEPVQIALVHDPLSAPPLDGVVPLVLAGHRHARQVEVHDGTLLLVEGSTGGAGLRGLEGEQPTPLECSVLYFDRNTLRLVATDEVTLGGLGTASVTVARHLPPAGAGLSTPTPTPAASGAGAG